MQLQDRYLCEKIGLVVLYMEVQRVSSSSLSSACSLISFNTFFFVMTLNEAWDTLAKLFSKKNEARLQLLDKELVGISQGTLSINKYFIKVKNICREISQFDPEEKVSEARMRRIIVNGLRSEYSGFMATVS
jgi:hypothetical protein